MVRKVVLDNIECEWGGCGEFREFRVYDGQQSLGAYCGAHADRVLIQVERSLAPRGEEAEG